MRRFLLASAAATGLNVAPAAVAQVPVQTPVPPVAQPTTPTLPDADIGIDADAHVSGAVRAPDVAQMPPAVSSEAAGAAGAEAEAPEFVGSAETELDGVRTVTPDAAAPRAAAEADVDAEAELQTAAAPQPMNAEQVCQARTTSVHFGRSNVLSRQNRDAIEQALDQASACNLEAVTIAAAAGADRRAGAVRALLERQGVPAEQIRVEEATDIDAGTGETQVRMTFAGIANANSGAALEPTQEGVNAAASAQQTASLDASAAARAQAAERAPVAEADANASAEMEADAPEGMSEDPNS